MTDKYIITQAVIVLREVTDKYIITQGCDSVGEVTDKYIITQAVLVLGKWLISTSLHKLW